MNFGQVRARGQNLRTGQIGSVCRMNGLVIQKGTLPLRRAVKLVAQGQVDDGCRDNTLVRDGKGVRPCARSFDKAAGAIDRIDDEYGILVQACGGIFGFFRQSAVTRPRGAQSAFQHFVHCQIGFGNGAGTIRFVPSDRIGTGEFRCDVSCGQRRVDQKGQITFRQGSSLLPEAKEPRGSDACVHHWRGSGGPAYRADFRLWCIH